MIDESGFEVPSNLDSSDLSAVPASTKRVREVSWVAAALVVPTIVAFAWVPFRSRLPNIDVALALVVVVMALGASGRRSVGIIAAVTAAIAFEFFDTQPYEKLAISRSPDVWTTVVLAGVGLLASECTVRFARQRISIRARTADLRRVRTASDLVASGQEAALIVQQISQELERLLQLEACCFEALPTHAGVPIVERDGTLQVSSAAGASTAKAGLGYECAELPVWGQGQILGHFDLTFKPEVQVVHDQLLVAVTLADQLGAALTAYSPAGELPPSDRDDPPAPLRIVR